MGALSRWLAPAALLVAVVAAALAIWALTSASSNAPAAAKQAGDPKMRVCTAFDTVSKAVRCKPTPTWAPIRSRRRRWQVTPAWRWSAAGNIC